MLKCLISNCVAETALCIVDSKSMDSTNRRLNPDGWLCPGFCFFFVFVLFWILIKICWDFCICGSMFSLFQKVLNHFLSQTYIVFCAPYFLPLSSGNPAIRMLDWKYWQQISDAFFCVFKHSVSLCLLVWIGPSSSTLILNSLLLNLPDKFSYVILFFKFLAILHGSFLELSHFWNYHLFMNVIYFFQ